MSIQRKVLWIVSYDKNPTSFRGHVEASGADTVCIRTTARDLPSAITTFHGLGRKVWGWRWPGVEDSRDAERRKGAHYFAMKEAEHVRDILIPAGLDGYIVDPESDTKGDVNDWNQETHKGNDLKMLASRFWTIIKSAAPRVFHCGTTSGCAYPGRRFKPKIPWKEFIEPSHAVYPQCYWRWTAFDKRVNKNTVRPINGGTPRKAFEKAMPAWRPVSLGKPIIPMSGELDVVTPEEIAQYGAELLAMNLTEAHFYADIPKVKPEVLAAIKAL